MFAEMRQKQKINIVTYYTCFCFLEECTRVWAVNVVVSISAKADSPENEQT
jgi:hypothetical protein